MVKLKGVLACLLLSLIFSCSSPGPRLYPQSFDSGKKSFEHAQPLMAIHWFKQALNEAHKQDNMKWEYRALQDLFYVSTLIESVQENGKYSESQDYHQQLSNNKWDNSHNKYSREAQSNFLKQNCDYKQSQNLAFNNSYKEFSLALCNQQFSQELEIESNEKNKGLSAWQQGRYKLLQNKKSEAITHFEIALEESKLKSKWLQRSLILKDLSKAYSESDPSLSALFLERATRQIKALEL
jgi:hypothetical protein